MEGIKEGASGFSGRALRVPPPFCQYSCGECDQTFGGVTGCAAFFIYPSQPANLAATVAAAVKRFQYTESDKRWRSWQDLTVGGRIIFCEVCKAIRFAGTVVADVTTLNFNLLFEIGYTIGLGVPVIPIRDVTYIINKREFDELGVLDTLGYLDFTNADELVGKLRSQLPGQPVPQPPAKLFAAAPLYVLKGPIDTEGAVRLMSTLKKSPVRFRTYDPLETPRLSLPEARRQVSGSLGVIAHLLSPNRAGSRAHNAMCALLAGLAMAEEKVLALLQEEAVPQPIDYRDVVQPYRTPDQIPSLLEAPIRQVVRHLQRADLLPPPATKGLLARLDLGDPAAENEIRGLESYFVPTGQFTLACQGHSRLVVGRKGSGKTAMFYAIRQSVTRGFSSLVLDLKPEGHMFSRLRDAVLAQLSQGMQEHTLTAFWSYILLAEIAQKIVRYEKRFAIRDGTRLLKYERVREVFEAHGLDSEDDFSQRLLLEVERVSAKFASLDVRRGDPRVTEFVYRGDIAQLERVVGDYLTEKESVWLLIDNLDKGWPTMGSTDTDVLIVRCLLEAARKLQRSLENSGIGLACLVFLRTDVFDHLVRETPDKGKDSAIRLDWEDREVFEEIVLRRIRASSGAVGTFQQVWPRFFEPHVGAQDSFAYFLDRTLERPRDLLLFLQRAVEAAVNRGHDHVNEDDIVQAEHAYSEDLLLTMDFEMGDVNRAFSNVLYAFQGVRVVLDKPTVWQLVKGAGVEESEIGRCVELLTWFGFLGVTSQDAPEARFSYQVRYNLRSLMHPIESSTGQFVVHPGFRAALGIVS